DIDSGVLPVGENDRLVGVLTDRDIVVRGVAKGLDPGQGCVRDAMTDELHYCFEDEEVGEIAKKMAQLQIRRMPVLSRDKRMTGIVSLGDLAVGGDKDKAARALHGVSQATQAAAQSAFAGNKPGRQAE